MALRILVVFLWLTTLFVAISSVVLAATGSADSSWGAAIFWCAVVAIAFAYDRKHRAEVK